MKAHLHPYSHRRGDARQPHRRLRLGTSSLGLAVGLTLGFCFVEVVAGVWSGSLALLADASHMATDSVSLLIALLAQWVAMRQPSSRHSYGHGRIEVLAGLFNGLLMLGLIAWIASEAIGRMLQPQAVLGEMVVIVAVLGLLINAGVAWSLSRGDNSINTRAALVHVWGDLLGSVAALLAGAVIWLGGPNWVDPALSLLVAGLLLRSTMLLLRRAYDLLMEHVPAHISFDRVAADLAKPEAVREVHNLHIWEIHSGQVALTVHLELDRIEHWPDLQLQLQTMLREKHGIDHATIQPEVSHP